MKFSQDLKEDDFISLFATMEASVGLVKQVVYR